MAKQALDGKRLNAFAMDPNDLVIIGLDTKDGPTHPLWDERINLPISEAMVRNIMFQGVHQNISVAKDGDRVLVVAGRQRVKAAREANRRLAEQGKEPIAVPCMVKRGSDGDLFGVFVSENQLRENDSPLVVAKKAQRMSDMGKTDEEIAVVFGWDSTATVQRYLSLLDLSAKVQAAVEDGRLSASAAGKLAKLQKSEQDEQLAALVAQGGGGKERRVTARQVAASTGGTVAPSKRQIKAVAEKLSGPAAVFAGWILGEYTTEEAIAEAPSLAPAFKALEKKAKKAKDEAA